MGKSTKPTKWFKAVKKAFRSPSKERPPPDQSPGDTKGDRGDEKQLLTKHDFPPQAHPLPLFEIISHEVGSERVVRAQPLPTPETVLLLQSPNREEKKAEDLEEEEFIPETHDHQLEDGDDSAFSDEEEEKAAATRIYQRFHSNPLALRGLVRLQALVRGHLVRRQAAITLRTMEAIVRVQAVFRGRRVRMSADGRACRSSISRARRHSSRSNGIVHDGEKLQIAGSEVAEQDEASKRKRPKAYLITQQLKRTTPNQITTSYIGCNPNHPHKGWAWLELWTKTRPWDNSTRHCDSDSKESYIEINPNHSQCTTKEVDVNTKVKYYEDFISDLAPKRTKFSSRLMKERPGHKPLQIEVPDTDEEDANVMVPSSSLSEGDVGLVSPQGSDAASVCVPETPPGIVVDFGGGHEPREADVAMEQLVLPEAHVGSDGADPALSDSSSVSNGVHLQGDDALGSASDDVANGHTSNGHHDNQPGKEENQVITNGETPAGKSRGATCRYMAATQSAKAKFRSSSNPKTSRTTPETPESPVIITKRHSTGSGPAKAANQSPKLAARKSSNGNRRSPSPVISKEMQNKPRSVDLSPARRNSFGGDGKRWRT